ncbi:29917_t:CDS:2, partial [Racocetra persica]
MANFFEKLFNFGSKNKNNQQNEQNVSQIEDTGIYGQNYVTRYKATRECLDLTPSSTGNVTSVSTHNKNNTRSKEQSLYAPDKLSHEITNLHETLKAKDNEIGAKNNEIEAKNNEIEAKNNEIEAKNNEIEAKNNEIEAKNNEISGLRRDIEDLKNEASRHQSALGRATNFRLSDDDRNNSVQLREDITSLQQTLKDFCIVKPNININKKEATNLLRRYGCTKFIDDEHFKSLLKAALQRFVLETILDSTSKYFEERLPDENTEERSLETRIVFETKNLLDKMKHFAKFREGDDDVTRALPIKLRQQIYAVLGNRGFSKVISKDTVEHPFINETQEQLIRKINSIRTINDPNKITKLNNMAANIVRDVIRIFFFRLKVQEPEADSPHWFEYNDQVDPELMQGTFEHDCQDVVQICSFPLIGIDLKDEKKRKIFIPAM